ncbi:MAG: PaaI family thioesterase [Aminivibrio sp.]|jgi:uncharacterized protein (TIGR00369 family)|nr:PaaI family thioesterase [Synergistaceae bacterium]
MEKLPRSKGCFVCGSPEENSRSLGVDIFWDGENERTVIKFLPDSTWCGYEGIVHGGIIASIFDDAMAWAARQAAGGWAVTGEMSVRYLRPVKAGMEYTAEGRVSKQSGRRLTTEAALTGEDGKRAAEATALFIKMPARKGRDGVE